MKKLPQSGNLVSLSYNALRIWDTCPNNGLKVVGSVNNLASTYGLAICKGNEEIVTCRQNPAACRFYKKTTATTYIQTTLISQFPYTYLYSCGVLPSGNVVVATSSSPYVLEIYDTATEDRFWEGTVDPQKLFDQFQDKMKEFEVAEEEQELKKCISINLEMQKLMQQIKENTHSNGGAVSKTKNRIARQIFELTRKSEELQSEIPRLEQEIVELEALIEQK
eukprot:UN28225